MLKNQNNPAVLGAIADIIKTSRPVAIEEEISKSKAISSRYSKFTNASIEEAKKKCNKDMAEASLDPVGGEDADINNDSKVDSTDKYLKNRRKKITAAVKEDADVKEGVLDTVKKITKKVANVVAPDDETLLKDLQKKVGVPQTGKKPEVKEDVEQVDEARGRPRKQPTEGDDGAEPDQHIHVQLKKAADASTEEVKGRDGFKTKGGADVKFGSGSAFVHAQHAQKVLSALDKLKPADREKMHSHIQQSHANFMAVHKLVS